MRITRLQVRNLRRYRDLDIALHPAVTVIRGPNEAGKSTIQRAIELALFRRVTSAGGEVDSLRTWGLDDDARPSVRIEFVQEDLEATRSGSLAKEFRGSKGRVSLAIDGETITDPARADARLAELTGIPTEGFFRSTASIRHHELADLDRDEAALRDRLQASISGGDRGTSRAKKKLQDALRGLQARGDKNPGRLKVAEQTVARHEGVVRDGEMALAQLERDRDSLIRARERRAQVDRTLQERRSLLEKARQAERLSSERGVAQERFERYREAVSVTAEIEQLHDSHPSPEALPVLRQIVERLRALETRIRELRAALGEEVEVDFEVTPPAATWRPIALFAVILAVIAVGAVASGAFAFGTAAFRTGAQVLGVVLVVAALLAAILSVRQHRASGDLRLQKQLRDDQITRRLRGRSQLEQELRQAEKDQAAQLEAISQPDLAGMESLLAAEEAHVGAIDRLTAQLVGLVGHEPSETLPGLRDGAALEVERKAAALEALGPIAREPRARERLEVEVRDEEAALERARDDEAGARARVEANAVDAEQVALETERLATWRDELAALRRRTRIYETTLAAIDRAEEATMKTATRYLEKRMTADIARITDGRYRRVQVDDRTLDMRVLAPERGDWVDVAQLSKGTMDQVYLAARLGLVRLVTEDRRPPLLFDDPFVTFDGPRAARAMTLLRELAADFQVIYLTCSDRYDSLADAVVELPGPIEVDDGSAVPAAPVAAAAGGSDVADFPTAPVLRPASAPDRAGS